MKNFARLKNLFLLVTLMVASGCAHSITINPSESLPRPAKAAVNKRVAYVLTSEDRAKSVTTAAGAGDKISYFPYRDLEKILRESLRSVFDDVFVVDSLNDQDHIKKYAVAYVFDPEITTTSHSGSIFTWPPTTFEVDLSMNVTDPKRNMVTKLHVTGKGEAEFSEFKNDLNLAPHRAASDMAKKLVEQIKADPKLK